MHPAKSKQLTRPWMPILAEPKLDTYDIRRYSPVNLADEMTLINQMLLLRIKAEEFDHFAFLSPQKVPSIASRHKWTHTFYFHLGNSRTESNSVVGFLRSNVCSMCDADSSSENGQTASLSDRTSLSGTRKVCNRDNASCLVSLRTESERNDRFQVIQQLYTKNHDLHSIRMILAAFDHPSVFRLRDTWRTFRSEKPKFYTYVFVSPLVRDDTVALWPIT